MSFFDKVSDYLDQSGITSVSKIYTPFTLFCIFFSIYFNAENLWIFLTSYKWEDQLTALKLITDRSFGDWSYFLWIVITSSIGLIAAYSVGQLIAAVIWRFFNFLQSRIAYFFSKYTYVKEVLLLQEEDKSAQLRSEKRELQKQMAQQEWTPEGIRKLQEEFNTLEESSNSISLELDSIKKEKTSIHESMKIINKERNSLHDFMTGYHNFIFLLSDDKKRAIDELISQAEEEKQNLNLFLNPLIHPKNESLSAIKHDKSVEFNTTKIISFQSKEFNISIGLFSRICTEFYNAKCTYELDKISIKLKSSDAENLHNFVKNHINHRYKK